MIACALRHHTARSSPHRRRSHVVIPRVRVTRQASYHGRLRSGSARAANATVAGRGLGPDRPGDHHRVLGRRQVDRDGRLRGRGLLLRGQPALGDDPVARRPVHARGLEGAARGGRVRRPRRRVLRRPGRDARRPAGRRRQASRAVPRRRRADAADPLQGDAPAPPARAEGQRHRRHRPRARAAERRCAGARMS